MAFTIIQPGDELWLVGTSGLRSPVTLPEHVTLRTDVPPRFLVSGNYLIVVNTPSIPLLIDGNGTARLLAPRAPRLGPVLSGVSGGTLSGTYSGVRYTFVVFDEYGNLLSESDYSPASNSVTITTDFLKAANLDISPDDISGRRIYRPTTDGATLFQWIDLDGNVLTEVQDDLSDAGLSLFPSPTLGQPPYLTHIAEFRGRLFGVDGTNNDNVRYTEAGFRYAWPEDNVIPIQPVGGDEIGVTAFLPRRDALGVARQNQLWQITGSGAEVDGVADLEPVRLSEILGTLSQESVAVYRDTAYFLWYDGVYKWNSEGIECISDGSGAKGNVRSWFATDDFFDRTRYNRAFAAVDPLRLVYKLMLDSPDGEKQWVEYDLVNKTWWGPHKTLAFTPTSMFAVRTSDEEDVNPPAIGADDGQIYIEHDTRTDVSGALDVITPYGIEMDVVGKRHDAGEPDLEKVFGELSLYGKPQEKGELTVTSTVGELYDEDDGTPPLPTDAHPRMIAEQTADLTKSRNRLGRLGQGKHAELEFTHDEAGEDVELFGYDVTNVVIVGRR
jgi:hypothetical protein